MYLLCPIVVGKQEVHVQEQSLIWSASTRLDPTYFFSFPFLFIFGRSLLFGTMPALRSALFYDMVGVICVGCYIIRNGNKNARFRTA